MTEESILEKYLDKLQLCIDFIFQYKEFNNISRIENNKLECQKVIAEFKSLQLGAHIETKFIAQSYILIEQSEIYSDYKYWIH